MKRILTICVLSAMFIAAKAEITETATIAVQSMGVGWNLGNTLDACAGAGKDVSKATYWGQQGVESETYWNQPVTKPELFKMMKNAGYGAIRVPVTWFNHMDAEGNVDSEWMKRVHQVVDDVIDNNLYCILNVHHDTGADSENHVSWIKADKTYYKDVQSRYEHLWKQIANEFKDYGKKLLFEGYNEMLDTYNSWCFASFSAPNNYNATIATAAYDGIHLYAQSFVNTVRSTGGNNATRNLIINTYAASCGSGTWNSHLQDPLKQMKLPDDKAGKSHLIFEVHSYPTISNSDGSSRALKDIKGDVDQMISALKTHLISQGAPVIIGEWGTSGGDGKDYVNRRSLLLEFVDYFVQQSKKADIATFHWMGLTDGLCRSIPAFGQADLAERIVKAYHGSTFKGVFPDASKLNSISCFDGDKVIGWGDGITIPASLFANFGKDFTLELCYTQESRSEDIQFYYGNWSGLISSIVDDTNYSGDFHPSAHYKTGIGTSHTTLFSFDSQTRSKLSQLGMVIHGSGIRLTKVSLNDSSVGISVLNQDSTPSDARMYNLLGQPVSRDLRQGLFIQSGHKMIVR